jgi:hypothetical protein
MKKKLKKDPKKDKYAAPPFVLRRRKRPYDPFAKDERDSYYSMGSTIEAAGWEDVEMAVRDWPQAQGQSL